MTAQVRKTRSPDSLDTQLQPALQDFTKATHHRACRKGAGTSSRSADGVQAAGSAWPVSTTTSSSSSSVMSVIHDADDKEQKRCSAPCCDGCVTRA